MSDKNIIGLRLKCLELAVISQTQSIPMFPTMEVHNLAKKYEHYVETGEWQYDINTNENGEE